MSSRQPGFTLAEVLIALALLGVIAAFTIPKILQSQNDSRRLAVAKETMAMISEAYIKFRQDQGGNVSSTAAPEDLFPYFNSLGDYLGLTDGHPSLSNSNLNYAGGNPYVFNTSQPCDCSALTVTRCIRLANGAVMAVDRPRVPNYSFQGTTAKHAVTFVLDADGQSGNPGSALVIVLFYSGRITTGGTLEPGVMANGLTVGASPIFKDPAWFKL